MKIIWALIIALGVFSMNAAAADAGEIEEGKRVYQYWCWNCHAEGVGKPGTHALAAKYKSSKPAILDQRADLTPTLTKFFVRKGIPIMPPFRKTEITDAQLDSLGIRPSTSTQALRPQLRPKSNAPLRYIRATSRLSGPASRSHFWVRCRARGQSPAPGNLAPARPEPEWSLDQLARRVIG
jgi:mono/diheme cytochrome c family protein